jgi:hypothetical protein
MEWKSPMATKYGVTSLPRAILVDKEGKVVATVARGERLFQHLRELLGPPSNGLGGIGELNGAPSGDQSDGESGVVPAAFEDSAVETPSPTVPEN